MTKLNNKQINKIKEESLQKIVKAFTYVEGDKFEFENYDEVYSMEEVNGVNKKYFVRLNPIDLPTFLDEMKSPNNYVVPSKKLICEGLIPEKISVIVKENDDKRISIREVISSQIVNLFGINTCFNSVLKSETENSQKRNIVSVDFVSGDEDFISFYDFFNVDCWGDYLYQIKEINTDIYAGYHDEEKDIKYLFSKETADRIKEEYTYSYLVRRALLRDSDFGTRNCGLLINKKTGDVKLINYDYEFANKHCFLIDTQVVLKELPFIKAKYPTVYQRFIKKVEEISFARERIFNSIETYEKTDLNEWGIQQIMSGFITKTFERVDELIKFHNSNNSLNKVRENLVKE